MMNWDMEACPFCGHESVAPRPTDANNGDGVWVSIYCPACGAQGPAAWQGRGSDADAAGEQARVGWNRRTAPPTTLFPAGE